MAEIAANPPLPEFRADYVLQEVDAAWLSKEFDLAENGSRYVHRSDKAAMFTFLKEALCLCACRRVINIGGFLNDQAARIWQPPYHESPAALTALAV